MVAYSFKKRFKPAIIAGDKPFTIRGRGKRRHARTGDMVQLYCGMRTKHCHKIQNDVACRSTHDCIIHFERGEIVDIELDGRHVADLERFACYDGFEDLSDMSHFWADNHGTGSYTGRTLPLVLVNWGLDIEELFS